jgi:hypothetical protein
MSWNPDHSLSPDPSDLPAQRFESLTRAIDQFLSTTDLSTPDPLHTRDHETFSTSSYRLAGSPRGTGGSNGTLLDEAAATLDYTPVIDHRDPESLKEIAREYRERAARSLALEEAAIECRDAVHAASVIRHRVERRRAALRRKAERGGKKDSRRANRPVKVEVNPAAWEAVKREAVRRRRTVGFAVGELVCRSVQDGVVPRNRPQPSSVRRFARLLVDEETWAQFRVLALDAHLSIGRFVGLLVEREARGLDLGDNQ